MSYVDHLIDNSSNNTINLYSTLLANNIASEFNPSKTGGYVVGDYVFHEGQLYKTITAHTGAWSNGTDFSLVTLEGQLDLIKNNFANQFSLSSSYTVGDYVVYNGSLYCFKAAHSAGTWNSDHVDPVNITNKINDIKDTLNILNQDLDIKTSVKITDNITWVSGRFNYSNGNPIDTDNQFIRTNFFITTDNIDRFYLNSGYIAFVSAWNKTDNSFVGTYNKDGIFFTSNVIGVKSFDFTPYPNYNFKLALRKDPASSDITISDGTACNFYQNTFANIMTSIAELSEETAGSIAELSEETAGSIAELSEEMSDVNNLIINQISIYEDTYKIQLTRGRFAQNVYNPSTQIVNNFPYRISARTIMNFPYDITLIAETGFRFYIYLYNESDNTYTTTGWKTTYNVIANQKFYMQIARETDDTTEEANIQEFLSAISVTGNPLYEFMTKEAPSFKQNIRWRQGGYAAQNNKLISNNNADRISTQLFPMQQNIKVFFKTNEVRVACFYVDKNGTYTGAAVENNPVANRYVNFSNLNNAIIGENYEDYKFTLTVVKDNSTITPEEVSNYVDVIFQNDEYIRNGKQVLTYQFGGKGNDWCFVRTPNNYNQYRVKPYPFVICNHGNGWVMDGTLETANWTKRTMYVPLDDADYQRDSTEYNGTSDESLWYSNPTIEALLDAGYVVCGCENYGDNLFGNNNCRNACVDFFYHMVKRYNVEDRCYMIGASNGAMTSLNAAYILQGRVKAMILQYPLTCLVNQYQSYSAHRSNIRTAYGITDENISLEDLAAIVATHDPLTTDVIDGHKVGTFPPVKIYYSPNDIVVNYQQNALALATMLGNSGKVVETVQCSGEHGDHTHFAPADYVAWFNAN